MSRPKIIEDGITVWARIPLEWKRKIEEMYGNISEFVREAVKEKLAREESSLKEIIVKEIQIHELEIQRLKSILNGIEEKEKTEKQEKEKMLEEYIKIIFSNDVTPAHELFEDAFLFQEYLEDCRRGEIKPETVGETVKEKLDLISEKLQIPISEVCKKALDLYPELREVMEGLRSE